MTAVPRKVTSNLIKKRLLQRLGHDFKDPQLVELALTHRSCGARNNERLEFLGDSILNFTIGDALFLKFPNAKEGQLSRLRAQLVKGETLAEIAREFDLGDCLNLGEGELKSGGFRRDSILADAVEAIIGAVYVDAGMEACRDRILCWYQQRLETISLEETLKDPKTRLQELMQARRKPLPQYEVVSIDGEAHAQLFTVQCQTALLSTPTEAQASSRRTAEKLAAEEALRLIQAKG